MVSRGLTPAQVAQFGGVFHPVVLVWIDWPSGAVRAHSGRGPISWGGYTWDGVGGFGEVSVPAEALKGVLCTGDPTSGTVPVSNVIGKARFIVWPPGRWGGVSSVNPQQHQ